MLAIASATSFALGAAASVAAHQMPHYLEELETAAGCWFVAGFLLIGSVLPGLA